MIKQYTDDYSVLFETDYQIDNVDEILVHDGNFFIGITDDNENMLVVEYENEYLVCTEMTLDELLNELQENNFYGEPETLHELEDDYREFYTSC